MILLGGGGNKNIAEEVTERLLSKFPSKSIFVIPFAKTHNEAKERLYSVMTPIAEKYNITLVDGTDPSEYTPEQIVYIPGGNQDALFEDLNNIKFKSLIEDAAENSYLTGDSAGTVVLGEIMFSGYNKETAKLKPGLGLLKNSLIIPHIGNPEFEEWILPLVSKSRKTYPNLNIISIKEGYFIESKYPFDKNSLIGVKGTWEHLLT